MKKKKRERIYSTITYERSKIKIWLESDLSQLRWSTSAPGPCFQATERLSAPHPPRKQIEWSIHSSTRHSCVKIRLSLYIPMGQMQLLSYKGDNQFFLKRNKAMQLPTVYLPTTRLWTRGDFPEISMIVCCFMHYLEDFQVVFLSIYTLYNLALVHI